MTDILSTYFSRHRICLNGDVELEEAAFKASEKVVTNTCKYDRNCIAASRSRGSPKPVYDIDLRQQVDVSDVECYMAHYGEMPDLLCARALFPDFHNCLVKIQH